MNSGPALKRRAAFSLPAGQGLVMTIWVTLFCVAS
jgi:hypothetical protein